MTRHDREQLAKVLAKTLSAYNDPRLRGAVIAAKDAIDDMIYSSQKFEHWQQFNDQWRRELK